MSTIRTLTIALAATTAAIAPTAALAKDGDVRARAACTKGSTAKLVLSRDDGRIETELEVDQNRNGVRWKVTLLRNGRRVASANATTRAPSGSFEVRRRLSDRAGTDRITARARNAAGETCTVRASM
jgi:2-methylaconitate cis-trans-isomerase PrpF